MFYEYYIIHRKTVETVSGFMFASLSFSLSLSLFLAASVLQLWQSWAPLRSRHRKACLQRINYEAKEAAWLRLRARYVVYSEGSVSLPPLLPAAAKKK
jgi:hypothetical protein